MFKAVIFSSLLGMCMVPYDGDVQIVKHPALVVHISQEYKKPHIKVIDILSLVDSKVDKDFPRKSDILAVMAIESRFKESARSSSGATGLMQILYIRTASTEENIKAGIWLLRDYRKRLGSEKAAIQAYNVGIGNYLKGKRNNSYYNKYLIAKVNMQEHIT